MDSIAQTFVDALSESVSDDELFHVTEELLATPMGQLAVAVTDAIVKKHFGGSAAIKSALLPIIIGLLPILADLLQQNCAPEADRLIRATRTKIPFLRRRYANQINVWTMRQIGVDAYREVGGRNFGTALLEVLGLEQNEPLVREAYTTPAPVWGIA